MIGKRIESVEKKLRNGSPIALSRHDLRMTRGGGGFLIPLAKTGGEVFALPALTFPKR